MLRGSWNISLGMNMKRIFIWWYAKRFLHPRIVATYDYVFVRDDDLGVEHFDPEEYIKLVRKYGLEISQLGFLEPNGGFTWQMTNKRDDNEVHNTIPTVGRRKLQPFLAPPRSSIEMPWSIRYPASKGEKEKGTFPLLEVQYHAIGECHSDFGDGEQFPSVCMLWGLDRCLILRVNGELSQLDLNDGRERELTDSVELFWVTCGLSEEKTNLIEKVSWLDYGPQRDASKILFGKYIFVSSALFRDKSEEALRSVLSAKKPNFFHCLEWLLFTLFDAEISK
ncbi:hypothetical protein RHGRI_017431 [Rhododendron griersonianum]|nr:hypothetical protein RHGRI_017431 [Rhododendron griersonianum]